MSYVVGLTGGVGSGKSAAADAFARRGIAVVDTDAIAHQLTGPAGAAMPAIREAFGDEFLRPDGALERERMRQQVFTDPERRRLLESILHPLIREESARQVGSARSPYVILVVPLLVETGADFSRYQRILVVDCDEATQVERVMRRSRLTEHEVRHIIAAQADRMQRLSQAHDIISNNGTLAELDEQVEFLHRRYLSLAAGLRESRARPGPEASADAQPRQAAAPAPTVSAPPAAARAAALQAVARNDGRDGEQARSAGGRHDACAPAPDPVALVARTGNAGESAKSRSAGLPVIVYEYPLNERVRTLLRLEDLFERIRFFLARDDAPDHHVALLTLFEILEVASRADLKSDLLQELERQKQVLSSFRSNPEISEAVLARVLAEVEQSSQSLFAMTGKIGQYLRENEWLMSIKQRTGIPGGACEFDLPSYHYWLHRESAARMSDLASWINPLFPIRDGTAVVLKLLREGGKAVKHVAHQGSFSQMMGGRVAQMVRITLPLESQYIPEISANKYALNIRFTQFGVEPRPRMVESDVEFEMRFCNL
ncbi:MAG: cell division protein ZapD [Burkholderiales bacterium]|nr:cell division protein ZapD [Burkholderiales bacterium]